MKPGSLTPGSTLWAAYDNESATYLSASEQQEVPKGKVMKKVLEGRGVACTHEELGGGLQPTHSSISAAFSPSPTPALASGQGFSRQTSAARVGAS